MKDNNTENIFAAQGDICDKPSGSCFTQKMVLFIVLYIQKTIETFFSQIRIWWVNQYIRGYFLKKEVQFNPKRIKIKGIMPYVVIKGKVTLGDNIVISSGIGCVTNECHSIIEVTKGARLIIGNNSGISNTCIHVRNSITIGKHVDIGSGCFIADSDFHSLSWKDRIDRRLGAINQRTAPIVIGDYVFIGAKSIILKGVTIGEKSIVGAGSVVSQSIPSGQVWAGNPARFIKNIE